jgi:hypothetical protein
VALFIEATRRALQSIPSSPPDRARGEALLKRREDLVEGRAGSQRGRGFRVVG